VARHACDGREEHVECTAAMGAGEGDGGKGKKKQWGRRATAICMCTMPIPCFTKRNTPVKWLGRDPHVEELAKISHETDGSPLTVSETIDREVVTLISE